jgi:hypothetical protein
MRGHRVRVHLQGSFEGGARGRRIHPRVHLRGADERIDVVAVHAQRFRERLHRIGGIVLVEEELSPRRIDVRVIGCQLVGVAEEVVGFLERLRILEVRERACGAREPEVVASRAWCESAGELTETTDAIGAMTKIELEQPELERRIAFGLSGCHGCQQCLRVLVAALRNLGSCSERNRGWIGGAFQQPLDLFVLTCVQGSRGRAGRWSSLALRRLSRRHRACNEEQQPRDASTPDTQQCSHDCPTPPPRRRPEAGPRVPPER